MNRNVDGVSQVSAIDKKRMPRVFINRYLLEIECVYVNG